MKDEHWVFNFVTWLRSIRSDSPCNALSDLMYFQYTVVKYFCIMKLFIFEFWNKYFLKEKAMTLLEKGVEILSDEC